MAGPHPTPTRPCCRGRCTSANLVLRPLFEQVGQALNGPDGGVNCARAIVNASRTQTLLTLDAVIIVAIIADMVLKPFS